MTVDCAIYAVGGGNGHTTRGSVLQKLLNDLGIRSQVIVRKLPPGQPQERKNDFVEVGSPQASLAALAAHAGRGRMLIVDTFAAGWWNELGSGLIRRFTHPVFVARYSRELNWKIAADRFETILAPYPEQCSEWSWTPAAVKPIGYCLKDDRSIWKSHTDGLQVVDPGQRCTPRFDELIQRTAAAAGLAVRYARCFSELVPSRKFLVLGAGYNTVYESLQSAADVRFVPVEKRFDDQFRRAALVKRRISSGRQLAEWLGEMSDGNQQSMHHRACCTSLAGYL